MTGFIEGLLTSLAATVLVACSRFAWNKHKDRLADWYYVARYHLTKPFKKDSFNASATIKVKVVGVIKHNPYSGKWERIDFH